MKVDIKKTESSTAISPAALSAYARSLGWAKTEQYGKHSDVYNAEGLPEIILPRTQNLADYSNLVSQLITIFANVSDIDMASLYRDLVTADRDVIRLRVSENDNHGSIPINDGVALIVGAKDMISAAARSFQDPRSVYHGRITREVSNYLRQVCLGEMEQGSFIVTILSPVIPPIMQNSVFDEIQLNDDPLERQMTKQLESALTAIHSAMEQTNSGDVDAFCEVVSQGVSANLCEAVASALEPFAMLDTSFSWARTRPIDRNHSSFRFVAADAPILREAARSLRSLEPRHGVDIFGLVQRLQRGEHEMEGKIVVRASIDGKNQLVEAFLRQSEYEQAVEAHRDKAPVVMRGNLDRGSQRWQLLNPSIIDVINDDIDPEERLN